MGSSSSPKGSLKRQPVEFSIGDSEQARFTETSPHFLHHMTLKHVDSVERSWV
jgi:hypothetical protein